MLFLGFPAGHPQSVIFDFLDHEALFSTALVCHASQTFLQNYLSDLQVLSIDANHRPTPLHRCACLSPLLPLAVRFCRRLTRIRTPITPHTSPLVARLIMSNASILQHVDGPAAAIDDVSILAALLECHKLKSLHVEMEDTRVQNMMCAVVAQCQELKSLKFGANHECAISDMLTKTSPQLTELSTSMLSSLVIPPRDLELIACRFSHLQTLQIQISRDVEAYVPQLRELVSLTALSVSTLWLSDEDAIDMEEAEAAACDFLLSRGYDESEYWDDPGEPEHEIEIVELPMLQKLELDSSCTNHFVVKSEVLQVVDVTVPYDSFVAFETLQYSPVLRKIDVSDLSDSLKPGSCEVEAFLRFSTSWSHLTHFSLDMSLEPQMLGALVSHCRCLKEVTVGLSFCAVSDVLALFALPDVECLDLSIWQHLRTTQQEGKETQGPMDSSTTSLEAKEKPDVVQGGEDFECLPPIIHSNVKKIVVRSQWHQALNERIHGPRLRHFEVNSRWGRLQEQGQEHYRSLRFGPLLCSAAESLVTIRCNVDFRVDLEKHLPSDSTALPVCSCPLEPAALRVWPRLETIVLDPSYNTFGGSGALLDWVRRCPRLQTLTVPLHSPVDLGRLLNLCDSPIRHLSVDLDAASKKLWRPGCLDPILPSLLHPQRLPPQLETLHIPFGTLSDPIQAVLPMLCACVHAGPRATIDVEKVRSLYPNGIKRP